MSFNTQTISRRALIVLSLVLATGVITMISSGFTKPAPKKHLGIATFSVKGIESDVPGAFKALAEDGFSTMEISNYNVRTGLVAGMKPVEYAALAKQYGLDLISSHARGKFDTKDEEGTLAAWGKIFDDHKAMGAKYVIFPSNTWAGTLEGLKADCALMNKIGDEANKRGIKLGYHNHNMEFATIYGTQTKYLDYLIENTDPEKVFFQMDVYWVTIGREDPVTYLKKYPTRFKLLHIKDDYVLGASGKIKYEPIFTQFYKNGFQDWFLELDAKMTPEQAQTKLGQAEQMRESQANAGKPKDETTGPASGIPGQRAGGGNGGAPQADQTALLRESLDAVKQSADFLMKSNFVK